MSLGTENDFSKSICTKKKTVWRAPTSQVSINKWPIRLIRAVNRVKLIKRLPSPPACSYQFPRKKKTINHLYAHYTLKLANFNLIWAGQTKSSSAFSAGESSRQDFPFPLHLLFMAVGLIELASIVLEICTISETFRRPGIESRVNRNVTRILARRRHCAMNHKLLSHKF